jgi:hypothetical protein
MLTALHPLAVFHSPARCLSFTRSLPFTTVIVTVNHSALSFPHVRAATEIKDTNGYALEIYLHEQMLTSPHRCEMGKFQGLDSYARTHACLPRRTGVKRNQLA